VNTSNHDIKVAQLINRRPCCGEVRIGKTLLHSGEATDTVATRGFSALLDPSGTPGERKAAIVLKLARRLVSR
jgi:hypothetical protein